MNLYDYVKNIFIKKKKIDVKELPSQGFFYEENFQLYIKKATDKDIEYYKDGFIPTDLGVILNKIKNIVMNNVISNYDFDYIRSIDMIFIFFEIVKFTKNKSYDIIYFDLNGNKKNIEFSSKYFNYFDFNQYKNNWNKIDRCFDINGYKYSLPSISAENCLTDFLHYRSIEGNPEKWNKYNYDFIYFLGKKEFITFDEIENLIQIFNYDLSEEESNKVVDIIKSFRKLQRYTLMDNGFEVDLSTRINLQDVWK
jgi:hypothetical protein